MTKGRRSKAAPIQWEPLLGTINKTVAHLTFDYKTELFTRSRLALAKRELQGSLATLRRSRITRIGRLNIRTDLGRAINTIGGILCTLEPGEKPMGPNRATRHISEMQDVLRVVATELHVQVNKESLLPKPEIEQAEDAKPGVIADPPPDATEEEKQAVHAAKAFQNINEAMRALKDEDTRKKKERMVQWEKAAKEAAKEEERSREDGIVHEPAPVVRESDIRDTKAITQVSTAYQAAYAKMHAEIDKQGVLDSETLTFCLLRGPVIFQCSGYVSREKLTLARVQFDELQTPGIQLGPNQGGRRESIPPFLIFKDQVLICIGKQVIKHQAATKRPPEKKGKLWLPPVRKPATQGPDIGDYKELRHDTKAILERRSGVKYIDLIAQLSPNNDNAYIVNSKFPGLKFVWLMPQAVYDKISPLRITGFGLPF